MKVVEIFYAEKLVLPTKVIQFFKDVLNVKPLVPQVSHFNALNAILLTCWFQVLVQDAKISRDL
jgi:hypothetical protein